MYSRPARSSAPGWPLKSQVAYAVTTDPPSEWPPSTTLPPSFFAASITVCTSPTATFMPHWVANPTDESGIIWKCFGTLGFLRYPR